MKKLTLLALAVVLVPGLAMAQQPKAAAAPATKAVAVADTKADTAAKPVIEIPEKVKDFGTVPKGEKIKAEFMVRNTGQKVLEINQVRPTCGCTVASFDHTVAPGATGKVDAEVDTTGFQGPITKAVLVYSNDPDNPQVNLVIKADVRAFVEALPRSLIRFNVLQGEAATEKVVLVPYEDSEFKVTGTEVSGGPYQVAYRELPEKERIPDRKGSQWEVSVTVPADAPEGMLNQKITVKTTAPKAPEVLLTVSGVVRPIVQVIPGEINFGTVPSDAPIGRNVIIINNRQGSELAISKAEVDSDSFKTEVIPLQAGQRFQIAVTMEPGIAKGTHKATLKVATNDPARKTIEIPVMVTVQ